jgi:hypothetical protein
MIPRSVSLSAVFALFLCGACEKKRALGEPCQRNDACESEICSYGIGPAVGVAVCTEACRGVGRSTCPAGWTCAGAVSAIGARDAPRRSVCLPREALESAAPKPSPTEQQLLQGEPPDIEALREGPAGKYLPPQTGDG